MTTSQIQERVLAGARFLDANVRGWRRKIRRRDLSLIEAEYGGPGTCGCVLAQLAPDGDYVTEMQYLGLDDARAQALGFDDPGPNADWATLTAEWKRVLREDLR